MSLLLSGCAVLFPPTLQSPFVNELPAIDGVRDEIWSNAPPKMILAKGNRDPTQKILVEIRSLHHTDKIAFFIRWPDKTRSDESRRFEWIGEENPPELSGVPEDQLALKFNMSGPMLSCMLAGKPYTDDVWHWKAARTNPTGYAQDRQFIVRRLGKHSEALEPHQYKALNPSHTPMEIRWKEDQGTPLVVEIDASNAVAGQPETFHLRQPTGSQADILAKGVWSEGYWTLELERKFDTGHEDDAAIDPNGVTKFALAVFDASEGPVHANTWWIKLKPRW